MGEQMEKWFGAALDYIPDWIEFQLRGSARPGCVFAIGHRGRVIQERAFGFANEVKQTPLTVRHRFRVASHSKSFTAAGVMKLREQRRLRLDDPISQYVDGLHPKLAVATVQQLLSHGAGAIRDGGDTGHWTDARPFRNEAELRADLTAAQPIEPSTRFKYSNHGYGLLGLMIESITGETYCDWIRREIVAAAGLAETEPDLHRRSTPLASGHSGKVLLGRRVIIPGDNPTHALAPATGFVSTAGDLVRFFSQLMPAAQRSPLSVASRREMIRRLWRDPYSSLESHYGLGIMSGQIGDWSWFGHSGGFQGFITRTANLPDQEITISVLTNSSDGLAGLWLDGIVHILRGFARNGAPTRRTADWRGRWWGHWGAQDLVPMANKVVLVNPIFMNPFLDASELSIVGRDRARITQAGGYASYGEAAELKRNVRGKVAEVWVAGWRMQTEARAAKALVAQYEGKPAAKRKRR